jgi:hypothetical protein
MNADDERGREMKRHLRWAACLAAAAVATSCAAYSFREMDAKTLAAKGRKGKILSVQTAAGPVSFSEEDPASVKDGAVVGNVHMSYTLDPLDIVEITPQGKTPNIVLKDGSRFRVTSTHPKGEMFVCEAVKTVCVPLDEIVRANVRTVNAAGSILGTLAGAVLVVGAVAVDLAIHDDDPFETFTADLVVSFFDADGPLFDEPAGRRSNEALLGMKDASDLAVEKEFWTMEWTPVDAPPGADGKLHVRLDNASGVPRGVDEAKLVVVDHPPGVVIAPDILGAMRAYAGPVVPQSATERMGDGKDRDITELVSSRDGLFWRSPGGDQAAGTAARAHDELTLVFPRPKGARLARLIVGAANSTWRAEFAREVLARAGPVPREDRAEKAAENKGPRAPSVYKNWEYSTLRVQVLTVLGWQTGQALFAVGPLPAEDMIYNIDLSDVGTDEITLKLSPPAGYWLIDHLAIDFGQDVPIEMTEVAAEEVDSPEAAEVLKALVLEDATTLVLDISDSPAQLTFAVPPAKEGMERSAFLRTVSCYEMPFKVGERKAG